MSYTAQELNTRIELQSRTLVPDPLGGGEWTWATYAEAFAKVEPLVGKEYVAAGAERSDIVAKVTLRWMDGIKATDRITMRGEAFEIVSVQNIKFRNRELLLYVKRLE